MLLQRQSQLNAQLLNLNTNPRVHPHAKLCLSLPPLLTQPTATAAPARARTAPACRHTHSTRTMLRPSLLPLPPLPPLPLPLPPLLPPLVSADAAAVTHLIVSACLRRAVCVHSACQHHVELLTNLHMAQHSTTPRSVSTWESTEPLGYWTAQGPQRLLQARLKDTAQTSAQCACHCCC